MACATGLVLVMGMSATVFAASQSPTTGTEFTFAKDLKGFNDSISSVSGPGVTFEYAVAPQAPNADNGGLTITDSQGHSATVSTGPEGGLTFKQNANTVSYPTSEMISASPEGASNISESKPREVTLVANIDAFKSGTPAVIQPGIYRYKVTETTDPSTLPAGVTNPSNTTDTTRYVDVYVTTEGISGISMHNGNLTSGKQAFNAATYTTKNVAVKKGEFALKDEENKPVGTHVMAEVSAEIGDITLCEYTVFIKEDHYVGILNLIAPSVEIADQMLSFFSALSA